LGDPDHTFIAASYELPFSKRNRILLWQQLTVAVGDVGESWPRNINNLIPMDPVVGNNDRPEADGNKGPIP
jgi:hypothetical protein